MGGLPGMRRDRAVWCRWEVFWHFILVWQLTLVWPELGYRTVQLRQAGALGLEINMTSGARPLFWAGVTNHLLTDSLGSTAPCPPTAPLTTVAAMSGDFESKPDVDSATVPNMPCASCSCFNSWGSFSPRASWPSPTQRLLRNSSQMSAMEKDPTVVVGRGEGAGEAWREDTIPLCFIHFCSGWLFPRKHVLGDFQHQQISYRRLCLAAGPPLHRPVWGLPPWTHQSSIPACPSVSHGTGINELHLCLHLLRASHQKPHLAHL